MHDIAIVGVSFKMPQDAEDEASFWKILETRKNVMTEWPESRLKIESFYDPEGTGRNKLQSRGAHFLKQDPAAFDAPFFSITAKEAAAMDPQHRLTLETAYRAFENAGVPVERLRGTRTAVFAASMSDDYSRMMAKDAETIPKLAITGSALSILPNRVSWYFDLCGPSVHVDTACSSSMVALDLACQSLYNGDADAALVVGANLILGPEGSVLLSNLHFLSTDSVCWSFDHRANGYARGEGVVGLVIKPVSAAVRDGDMIRAVIRSIGSNQDGRSPTMIQPSPDAQERLIRRVYQKAGLGFEKTRFFEAHGTGTPVGDPIEMKAIGRVFRSCRSAKEPLYVGSVKANIGHLEGSSGLAGVVKSMLVLEKGIIPPNALFEKMNPDIDADFYHVTVPTEAVAWPAEGLRRVSVSSYGFGGSNCHAVLDDAFHYIQSRGLVGNHCTAEGPPSLETNSVVLNGTQPHAHAKNGTNQANKAVNGTTNGHTNRHSHTNGGANGGFHPAATCRLLVWAAADEKALKRTVQSYESYYKTHISSSPSKLDQLAFTLAARRSHMLWRTFTVVDGTLDGVDPAKKSLLAAKHTRASTETSLAFVFTGQGAQYAKMGVDLLQYPIFEQTFLQTDNAFRSLGCPWSAIDELHRGDNINKPEYSQPLCTALQIALVELLRSFGVVPGAVVGHSSGEIAAAYAVGALSLASACKVAYYRGQLAGKLGEAAVEKPGAMLSANLPARQVREYLEQMDPSLKAAEAINVACINSPLNSTLSGPEEAVDLVKQQLDKDGIFAQKLNTGVAYHSPYMQTIASEYRDRLGLLEPGASTSTSLLGSSTAIPMVSTVTGQPIPSPKLLSTTQYWVDNMVSAVQFSDALVTLTHGQLKVGMKPISDLIEVGPHPALRRPVQDTLSQAGKQKRQIRYHHVLDRNKSALQSSLELVGQLFCHGHAVAITAANHQQSPTHPFRVDCPEYPFDHSHTYWAESRLSRDYRLREAVPEDTLGARFPDWNPLEPKWRKFLSAETTPWVKDHVITGMTLYPGTGMLVMAVEAVRQMCPENRKIAGYYIKEAHFLNPIVVGPRWEESTETIIQLRPVQKPYEKESVWSDVKITTQANGRWTECFRASIQTHYDEETGTQVDGGMEKRLGDERIAGEFQRAAESCTRDVDRQFFYQRCLDCGVGYGPAFQLLHDIRWDGGEFSIAQVDASPLLKERKTGGPVHPAVLDAAVHLLTTQATKGLSTDMFANVPTQLFDAWMASSGWQFPQTSTLRFLTQCRQRPGAPGLEGSVYILADDGSPLLNMQRMILKPVSTATKISATEDATKTKLLYGIEWKPQLGLLDRAQLHRACDADVFTKDEAAMVKNRQLLDSTLDTVVRKTLKQLSAADRERTPGSLAMYVQWMEQHVSRVSPTLLYAPDADYYLISDEELESRLQQIEQAYPPWEIFTVIARNLKAILVGEINPLQVAFAAEAGLAERFYGDLFESVCDGRFRKLLGLLAHENPGLKILEVGAGTGSMTSHVLSVLGEMETQSGGTRFAQYTYTDISPAFFEKARARFGEFADRMTFTAFDLERAAAEQGVEPGAYDLVIAGSVLHATTNLTATLQNIAKALKPGSGRLLYLEIIAPENVTTNFGFGVLPGWWSCNEEWRSSCPCIDEQQWDRVLKDNGFSGNDLILRDYKGDACRVSNIMVSTLLDEQAQPVKQLGRGRLLLLVPNVQEASHHQVVGVADAIRNHPLLHHREAKVLCLNEVKHAEFADDDILISLLEANAPFLATITDSGFQILKDMIKRVRNWLWVTLAGLDDSQYPDYGLMQGFLRSMRSEHIDKHIITLAVETSPSSQQQTCAEHVAKVFHTAFESASPELEYIVRGGQLTTARLVEEINLNETVRSLLHPQLRREPWQPGPPVKLAVGTPGFLDRLEFVEDASYHAELGPEEVEIEAKAWGLSFRDVFVALGRLEGDDLGYDCAGVVARVGSAVDPAVTGIRVGDRVCGSSLGCMRTYPRALARTVSKMPDALSFEAAASIISPGITAYYSLVDVARLRRGEKILIHSASGSTGQMAVWIAKMLGAEIFATVGFDDKKQLLMELFGIPADHIFYSRNTSFAKGVMRVTRGRGVDVVLNSLSGDGLRASWECMAPYGRFIEIGKADITANASLPMAGFARNVSFAAVDLYHVAQSDQDLACDLLQKTMDLITRGVIHYPSPLHVYPVSEVEQAFRYLQSGKNTGRIIISVNESDVVPKRLLTKSAWRFDPNASYVIAGGLGGLGRGIVRWMVEDKGAKHLILLSRSGLAASSSRAAAQLVADLRARYDDVNIVAPRCDVSSADSLSAVLEDCCCCSGGMPPIKGCINAAMALQDGVFENMTYEQWSLTIRSKVQTSWNLHRLLPQDLDFFVLLSSLAGIYGSIAQSNYAAGCNFQDALARYRTSRGQKAISLDIGWMRNIGIIAENAAYQATRKNAADMGQIEDTELMALLDVYCDPDRRAPQQGLLDKAQLLVGVVTPADLLARGQSPPALALRPLFAGFSRVAGGKVKQQQEGREVDFAALFRQAAAAEDRADIAVRALVVKLARALSIAADDVELTKQLSDYGVDSLMAVELRNWIARDFAANVAVFEIMGGTTIAAIGGLVVEKSEITTTCTSGNLKGK
ncbi:hypothetical protein QBC46DRAFT_294875 [Diplogelasinospora grovesii]|uniref:Polyketide synthase n=1 Tax=Diplogelasinospora grovesii TaxID=303347 RepID=A0AAN6N2E9_9PEZI|nr:hypothetical protein QBC46DRAFT_294875 [Diplogelasinospora grovesii]